MADILTWRATQPNGWHPRIQVTGDRLLVLCGFGEVWVVELDRRTLEVKAERRLEAGNAFPMGWIRPGVATWAIMAGGQGVRRECAAPWTFPVTTGDLGSMVAGNPPDIIATEGQWATYLATPGRIVRNGVVLAQPAGGALAANGAWLAHAARNDNQTIARYVNGAHVLPDRPTAAPMHLLAVGALGHLVYGLGAIRGIDLQGIDTDLAVTPWGWEKPMAVLEALGATWVVSATFDEATNQASILLRPWGDRAVIQVPMWATGCAAAFDGAAFLIAGYGDHGELTVARVPADTPRAVLERPVTARPPKGIRVDHPLALGYFYDAGRYGQFGPARNCTITTAGLWATDADGDGKQELPSDVDARLCHAIDAAGGRAFITAADVTRAGIRERWRGVLGLWVHEPTTPEDARIAVADTRAAVARAGLAPRPVILVVSAATAAAGRFNGIADALAPELYLDAPAATWEAQQAAVRALWAEVVAGTTGPLYPVGMAYDRGDGPGPATSAWEGRVDALEAVQAATLECVAEPRVRGLWWFDYGRPGGTVTYPRLEAWHAAQVTVSTPPALIETGGNVAPAITIEGTWPQTVVIDQGGTAVVRAVAKITQGPIERFEWRIRRVGAPEWTVVARNPVDDLDHHFQVGAGEWQIGLDGYGPGGKASTGADRRILVSVRTPNPVPVPTPTPTPDPTPAPSDQVVRFLAPNGKHYLTALNGGGWPGETFNGQPAGLITAHVPARDVGGWQDFALRGGKRKGTFGLRSVNGGWVTLTDDNRLIANVHKPDDYQPEGRQAFILAELGDGKLGIQGANGRWLAAIGAGGDAVIMDRETARDWERWAPSVPITIPELEPVSTRADRPLVGLIKPFGKRGIQDDQGPILATTLSRFYWMSAWATDRDRVLRELDADAARGYCPRVLAEVGTLDNSGFWDGQAWDGEDPRTQQMIADMTDQAAQRGTAIEWTAIGKSNKTRNRDQRFAQARRVGEALRGRSGGVLFLEGVNEPSAGWDGPGGSELRDLARALDDASGNRFLIATGSAWSSQYGTAGFTAEEWRATQVFDAIGDRGVGISHNDRDTSKGEEQDRPWRQGWDAGLFGDRWCDNEPIGPGSSVNRETRGPVLRSHRLVAHVCRAAISCLHGSPGVRGLERWEDQPAYDQAWKSLRFLDPDMVNGQLFNANSRYPGRPFQVADEFIRGAEGNGNRRGIVRCYTVQAPSGMFYTAVFGPVDYTYPERGQNAGRAVLEAQRPLTVKAVQQDSGAELWERQVGTGEAIEINSTGDPDVLLISR